MFFQKRVAFRVALLNINVIFLAKLKCFRTGAVLFDNYTISGIIYLTREPMASVHLAAGKILCYKK